MFGNTYKQDDTMSEFWEDISREVGEIDLPSVYIHLTDDKSFVKDDVKSNNTIIFVGVEESSLPFMKVQIYTTAKNPFSFSQEVNNDVV